MIGFCIKQGLCLGFENPADVKCIAVFIFIFIFFRKKQPILGYNLISHNRQYFR